jgi:hypothetical protein
MMTDNPVMNTCEKCGQEPSYLGGDWSAYALPGEGSRVLCGDCAADAGFCLMCGEFFGGTEEFMLTGIKGLCVDCEQELHESIPHDLEFENEDDDSDYADIPY